MSDFTRSIILLGPAASIFLFLGVWYFFKGSVLYKVGLVMGFFAMFFGILVRTVNETGDTRHYLWAIPMAIVGLTVAFRILRVQMKNPLMDIMDVFDLLSKGDIKSTKALERDSNDEFGSISTSANNLIGGFSNMATFAQEIGRGNLEAKYEVLSENDILGHSLLDMQKSLQEAKIEEAKRKQEDEKHFWTNEGFAKFGEILRNNSENNADFYYSIISSLVKYVGANQGGLFLINDEDENDKYIELVSMYAYERRKYANQRIEMGENLVGQCVLEGESIYMTEIPQNYIRVTSGLGDANPSSVLLVPLRFNEQIYGVIELAAFTEFEEYKKLFIEKLGESIASTISTYKINIRTVKLLEDSKLQSEELAAQEEEIRQNMEELQTTQEESARREAEMNNMLDSLHASALVAELDLTGTVLSVNENYARLCNSAPSAMLGFAWVNFLIEKEEDNFKEILEKVQNGEVFQRIVKLSSGTEISESYSIVNDAEGYPVKILNVGLQR